jgi:hypothetical protein
MSRDQQIFRYLQICQIEGLSLQKGMNFLPLKGHSILLMSRRANAPYQDRVESDGTLIYEGHDAPRKLGGPEPKEIDQPEFLASGKLTENGKFAAAARRFAEGGSPRPVRVYEKLRDGIWADNGFFDLVEAWIERSNSRNVFKFKLVASEKTIVSRAPSRHIKGERSRIIPSSVKQEVWLRDSGKCCLCHASDDLHFDHIIPYSKGGSSVSASNIQLLCARHNLEKRDKIE